ncbi:enoyl reductase [Streptomyces aurantiacus]|nr:enoyl reductase [Streptomyces aurantiacus]
MTRFQRLATAAILAGSVCLSLATSAVATQNPPGKGGIGGAPGNGKGPSGGVDGNTINSSAGGIVFDRSKNGSGGSVGAVRPTTTWTPPACWYAPKYTPEQLQKQMEPIWEAGSTGSGWDSDQRNRYVNGEPYKDFNKDKTGKGYFWDSFVDKSYPPGWDKCEEPPFWVDQGDPPPADIENAVTPEMLAQLAYAEIRVPGTEVTLAPEGTTKVNLPTWAWLDGADFKPVSVTASVPLIGIEATTTAEPVSLKIEPGTADATTYPASGVCELNGDEIGEAYAKGKAGETPPCGVKYLRSSGDGSYQLQATVTWKIHWTGTGVNVDQPLPDGEFGAGQDVIVQEIQSINR